MTNDKHVNAVIKKFAERSETGFKKYGTNLERTDLTLLDWVNHAQEEALDLALYLEVIKDKIKQLT